MIGKPGATIPLISTTADPTTGGGLDPSALTWTIYRNGVDITSTSSVSSNTDIGAGLNKASFVIPAGSAEGDQIQVIETATVSGVSASRENCRLTVVAELPGELLTAPHPVDYPVEGGISYIGSSISQVTFASGTVLRYNYSGGNMTGATKL